MSDTRRAGRLVVPSEQAPADKALLERSAIEELSHHADPWRVLRILSEFVEGFDALNEVGPAVTVFGSARAKRNDPYYKPGIALGAALARRGFAVITGGGPGIMEAVNKGCHERGGLGTLDELFESLTLAQTGKIEHFPIVLFGTKYWSGLIDWLKKVVLAAGAISPGDLEVLSFTDDPEEAAEMATRPLPVKAPQSRDSSRKIRKADV